MAASLPTPLLVGPLGATELLIILGIVILIFGSRKLPQLGRGLGEGIKNFRKSMRAIGGDGPEETEPASESKTD